jgi:hypothetical protein
MMLLKIVCSLDVVGDSSVIISVWHGR